MNSEHGSDRDVAAGQAARSTSPTGSASCPAYRSRACAPSGGLLAFVGGTRRQQHASIGSGRLGGGEKKQRIEPGKMLATKPVLIATPRAVAAVCAGAR